MKAASILSEAKDALAECVEQIEHLERLRAQSGGVRSMLSASAVSGARDIIARIVAAEHAEAVR